MYNIPQFKADDAREVVKFMHQHSFITLCGCDAGSRPVATHIPVLIEERDDKIYLLGHMMKQTDHHKAFAKNRNVLAIFTGPHTYISASWYVNKQQASTWNYLTVHAKGELTFLDEPALLDVLKRTTTHFENNEYSPALVENLPAEYIDRLVKAIVAFEIEVKELDHVFKLSQNKDEESYYSIIGKLKEGDDDSKKVAELMQQRLSN